MLMLTNTLSGHKEPFEPYSLPVKMYVCGLTPKNEPHLGHARTFIANDVIRRYLEYRGFPVTYVQNFTDIDDKIIAAGLRDNISPAEAARRYMTGYFRDMDRLQVRRADTFTYVTEYIDKIIAFIEQLIANGHAYAMAGDGDRDVYFDETSFPSYGKLSKRNAEAMMAGARIEADERKRDPRDFALWKAAKPGEPWWESPWGKGRPGWHIECSTMAMDILGPQIDIHGGGMDLIFPHHENEIAQSESLTGKEPFAKYWVHTGSLQIGDEKMAHSGIFIPIHEVLETVPAPALRLYMLAQSYRTQFVYFPEQVQATTTRWRRWVDARAAALKTVGDVTAMAPADNTLFVEFRNDFIAAMDDDFNTSSGVAVVDGLVKKLNDLVTRTGPEQQTALVAGIAMLDELTGVLGIQLDPELDISVTLDADAIAAIEAQLALRTQARADKNWQESDRIRDELASTYAIVIKDTAQGAEWKSAR